MWHNIHPKEKNMIDWKDISTAPKDGNVILLGYRDKRGKFAVRSGYWHLVHANSADKPWAWAWVCSIDPVLLDQRPTHWAELNLPEMEDPVENDADSLKKD